MPEGWYSSASGLYMLFAPFVFINTVILIIHIFELKDDFKQKGPRGIALAETTALEKSGCLLWVETTLSPF